MSRGSRMSSEADSEPSLRLAELEAEALHARDRYRLYRARVLGPGATSFGRLRELERAAKLAESRLQRAKGSVAANAPTR